ncbi:MAG: histidine kinase [Marmoricola sp.]|nr:histidine kinase [Marmoricola sp.]
MSLTKAWRGTVAEERDGGEVPILLIDDNAAKRLALKAVLAPLGYSVVEADSGSAGLRRLLAQDFAVILLDVRMPIMNGFETAALIRMRKQSEMTPIIFVTAHESDEVMRDRYAEGVVDFITTPVHPDELRAKVSVFANLYRQAQAVAAKARQVQATADQLRRLTETAPIGIFETDADNRYVYTNVRWSEITGISAEAALGLEWDVVVDQDQRSSILTKFGASQREATGFSTRLERTTGRDTAQITLLTTKRLHDGSGGVAGWVGTLADITAEAGAEAAMAEARDQATAASRLKSDFLANMSHEIRTPMNGVIGLTELLLETELDDQQREFAQTLSRSGDALMTVINGILDFSKVETGKLEVEDIEFSLQTVVDDVIDLLAPSARSKQLELLAVLEPSVESTVSGDPGRLRQVLTNLIGNAIKFTPFGQVTLRVATAPSVGVGDVIRFVISDTGVGIPADKLEMVFEPFTQADTSTTREYGGTGLGLPICSQLVALMGGEIGISSEVGVGSTFWFTVRVHGAADGVRPDGPDVDAEDSDEAAPAGRPALGRLLVAEDNLVNQMVAVAILSKAGYQVDTVRNGAEAVRAAASGSYDAILMDCQMPQMNGYQATAAIRHQEGPGRHTPIIAVTAAARGEDRNRCLAEGMDDYLAKPVRKGPLLQVVRDSVQVAAPADELLVREA